MFQIIFYRIIVLLSGKSYLFLKDKIKIKDNKLTLSLKYNRLKDIIRNNLYIKSIVIKLFYWSFLINLILYFFAVLICIMYNTVFIHNFSNVKMLETENILLSENGIWITNAIVIIFLLRIFSSSYKLSFMYVYNNKILLLDILTLNILSIIGILIFNKSKKNIQSNYDIQINNSNLNSSIIKKYLKLLWKVELFILLFFIILFILSFILIYFISNNIIKNIAFILIVCIKIFFYLQALPKFISMTIFQKMFYNLLNFLFLFINICEEVVN